MGLLFLFNFLVILIDTLSFLIFIRVILSWFLIGSSNRIVRFIFEVTNFIVIPIGHVIPPFGFFDFSPLVAFLLLQLLRRFLQYLFNF